MRVSLMSVIFLCLLLWPRPARPQGRHRGARAQRGPAV